MKEEVFFWRLLLHFLSWYVCWLLSRNEHYLCCIDEQVGACMCACKQDNVASLIYLSIYLSIYDVAIYLFFEAAKAVYKTSNTRNPDP
jgi:hypothetical protein